MGAAAVSLCQWIKILANSQLSFLPAQCTIFFPFETLTNLSAEQSDARAGLMKKSAGAQTMRAPDD